ncbi:hypothetical protein FRC19_010573 [Serendipita sp. 401]|nr:hypothetical protein FRC19_010573 [Serendipita sp. 401]
MDQHDPDEARIAHFEKEENFRWITSLLATTSPVELDQLVPESTQEAVYSLAEFAEIAHGSIDPNWVINDENRMFLGDAGFPLEQYPTLTGKVEGSIEPIELIKVFHGGRGQLQGFCALRMQPRSPAHAICNNESPPAYRPQIILAFSGTSNPTLALYDIHAALVPYKSSFQQKSKANLRVHSGFQLVYQAIKPLAFDALREAIRRLNVAHGHDVYDLIITAHSLGAAVSYLALLDLLHNAMSMEGSNEQVPRISKACNITIAVFGAPRLGNSALANHFKETAKEWRHRSEKDEPLTEWSIIGHMDGVPSLPPLSLGYIHFCTNPFYSFGGRLYIIPPSEAKHTHFKVKPPEDSRVIHSRGGHNYYGARDMERLQRRMKAIKRDLSSPVVTTYSNVPTRRHSLASSNAKEAGSVDLTSQSDPPRKTTRSSSLAVRSLKRRTRLEQPITVSQEEDHSESSEPRPIVADELTSEPSSQLESNPKWIQRYLERERAEEDRWKRKTDGKGLRGYVAALGKRSIFTRK